MTEHTIDPSILEELAQLEAGPEETRQGFRAIYRNGPSGSTSTQEQEDIVYITPTYDPELEVDVIYWKDIEEKFENALYLQNKLGIVHFIQDCDLEVNQPHRIYTVLEVTLDVIVENPLDVSENIIDSTLNSGD
ncbi:hypothetical protein BGZ76_004720 [Entomortierella beljakovae]|nr:hypothetical protein BGZ76_004720 [Entomortierella beljakovae]